MKDVWVVIYKGLPYDVALSQQEAEDYVDLECDIDDTLNFADFEVKKYTCE